jgi:hypothetical protein
MAETATRRIILNHLFPNLRRQNLTLVIDTDDMEET